MSSIWLPNGSKLKSYKAIVSGTKATVDIRVEINDHSELGWFLKELAEIEARQKAADKPERPAGKKARRKALPAPLLQIPYFEGDER